MITNDFYKNLPVLVTGGAGFIGSEITQQLVKLGAQVTVLDNLSTGNLKNLEEIKDRINLIDGDITNLQTCLEATKNQKMLFHLAAFISVPDSMIKPFECNNINVNGTVNLLESCRVNNVERFIFSSSAAVYGAKEGICSEDDICNPTSVYGFSKLIGETYCKQYFDLYGLNSICLRYFNVYGEKQNPKGSYAAVVAKFTDCMKNNLPITIFGDGKQTRDFIPVEKVAQANLKLATLSKEILNGQPVNVATGKSITLLELTEELKKKYPKYNQTIGFEPARTGDVKYSQASCEKLKKLI